MTKPSKTVIAALRYVADTGQLPTSMHWRLRQSVMPLVETLGDFGEGDWQLTTEAKALIQR